MLDFGLKKFFYCRLILVWFVVYFMFVKLIEFLFIICFGIGFVKLIKIENDKKDIYIGKIWIM